MTCMNNQRTKMKKTTKMTKILENMPKVTVTMTEMITKTQNKSEVNPGHY